MIRLKAVASVLFAVVMLSGCWDARDLEDVDIVTSVAVDYVNDKIQFYVSVPIISAGRESTSGGSGSSGGAKFTILHGDGVDFIEARENLERLADEPIFLGATQAMIFTESFASQGLTQYLLRFRQLPDFRKTTFAAITPNTPEEILQPQSENATSTGTVIFKMITNMNQSGETFKVDMSDILNMMSSANDCFLLHTFEKAGQDLRLSGYSVIYCGKYKGFIPIEESHGIVMLKAKNPKSHFIVPYSNGTVSVIVKDSKRKIKAFYKDGSVIFDITFNAIIQELYPDKDVKITDQQRLEIEENLQQAIVEELGSTIQRAQAGFGCDYLDFYTVFRIAFPDAIENMNWTEQFQRAQFNITANATLDLVSNVDYSERIE